MAEDRNVAGQTTAITTLSVVRWWGRLWLPVLFALTRRFPALTAKLRELSFISFARWCLISELPFNGAPQKPLPRPLLFFESNFNGAWDEYIEAFSDRLATGMRAFWGSSEGFPGALPVGPFKAYIRGNETMADHFYAAYDATSTQVQHALKQAGSAVDGSGGVRGVDAVRRLLTARRDDPNVSGQAYAFMAMTPIRPGQEGLLADYLRGLKTSPLARLERTHMGRFVIVSGKGLDPSYLVFTCCLDGNLDSYLNELVALPEAPAIWERCIGSEGALRLKDYLLHNQIRTGVFFAAYGHATVQEVRSALAAFPPPQTAPWASRTPGMAALVERAVALSAEMFERVNPYVPGAVALRDQHGRSHGCARGTMEIGDVPIDLRHGLFAEPGTYDVLVRWSPNAPVPFRWGRDAHGMAIKVLGLPYGSRQDFVLANTPVFFARDGAAGVELVAARVRGGVRGLRRYFFGGLWPRRWRLRELRNMIVAITRKVPNPLTVSYHSQTAYRCGERAVKYAAVPRPAAAEHRVTAEATVRHQLLDHGATFDLGLQRQQEGNPVNDPTRLWSGPVEVVAVIRIPPQEPIDCEDLTFSPGHTLPGSEPLGEVNELRVAVYEAISRLRHQRNTPSG